MRNLAAKVPEDIWPEFKVRAQAAYQAPSRAIARELATGVVADYGRIATGAQSVSRHPTRKSPWRIRDAARLASRQSLPARKQLTPNDLVERATGAVMQMKPYLDNFREKYGVLYRLPANA
jgi:hypothetical protein